MADARVKRIARAVRDPSARANVPPAFDRADAKDGHAAAAHVVDARRGGQIRIALEVMHVEHGLQERLGLVAHEAVTPIVERVAELNRADDRLELLGDRIEAEIVSIDRDRFRVGPDRHDGSCRRCPPSSRRSCGRGPTSRLFSMYCWLCVPKPVNTFRLMSATPSPSVSLKYQMSGGAATNTPPFQQATPPAQSRCSAKHGGRVIDAVAVGVPQQPHRSRAACRPAWGSTDSRSSP